MLPLPATEEVRTLVRSSFQMSVKMDDEMGQVDAKRRRKEEAAGSPWMDPSLQATLLSNGASTRP